jgi:hypothetical protein
MSRLPRLLAAAATLAAVSTAQCWTPTGGTAVTLTATQAPLPADDEGRSTPRPLGFAFPIAGASAATFTHAVIESNGVLYLTNNAPAVGPTDFGFADFIGVAGDSPRIAPFWTDLEGLSATWSVRTSSAAGVFAIQWVNVNDFGAVPTKSFRCRLFSTGNIEFSYSAGMNSDNGFGSIGVSPGNGTADPDGPGDLSALPSSADSIIYEDILGPGTFDLGGRIIRFNASGAGYTMTAVCTPAVNEAYGDGCYNIARDSYYEDFTTAVAPFDLANSALTMQFNGTGYLVRTGTTTFVNPPATATTLTLGDDDEATVTLTGTLNYPGGATTSLTVCSNGFVSAGANNGTNFFPDFLEHLEAPDACWRSWLDNDVTQAGSGQVKFHQTATIAYVTYDNVYSFGSTDQNRFQFQFNKSNGNVHILWQNMAGAANNILVGFSPGGSSADPGSVDLSAVLPTQFTTGPDIQPLTLTAAPRPVSTATTGTTVTFTTSNMPAAAPGVFVGLHIFSLGATPAPGLDLIVIGAPGCFAHVTTIASSTALVGATSTLTASLAIPAGVPGGTTIYSQSIALFPPNSLPGGLNAFGLLSSNGIASIIQPN